MLRFEVVVMFIDTSDKSQELLVELFNQKQWYLAHDVFEEIWHNINGLERITIQAILQIAVAEVHLENGNLSGAVILYGEGYGRIVNNNLPDLGVDLKQFSLDIEKASANTDFNMGKRRILTVYKKNNTS